MKERRGSQAAIAWVLRIVVVLALLALWFLQPFAANDRTTDTAQIARYDVSMDLSGDGDLSSVETIETRMPAGKRGIFKIFDEGDPRREGVDHPVDVESITRDGSTEPYVEIDGGPGTRTLRIGSENVYLEAGNHTYEIRSSTTGVFEPGDDGETLWWWDVVGSGWQMSMEQVDVTVTLPTEPLRAECVQGEDTPCTAAVEGTTLTVRTGPLDPYTPVTVRVAFPEGVVAAPDEGDSALLTIVLSVIAAALAAGLGWALYRATHEKEPGFPVVFEPPAGVSPAVGVKVLDEKRSSDEMQATLYDLGERGVVRLEGDDDTWSVHRLAEPPSTPLSTGELAMLSKLGLGTAGSSFLVAKSEASGRQLGEAASALSAGVDADARRYLVASAPGCLVKALSAVCLIATLAIAGFFLFGSEGWRPWPLLAFTGVFALASVGMLVDPGVATKRTAEGREVWSRTGGFARFLTTDSSESRFDAAKHMDWYPRYLPWALALGSADAWARRFESQGVATPTPTWLLWSGTGQSFSSHRMGDSFNAAIAGASAAYAASQVSSSGGGGGFSGGSGGGGGGGGSW
ncbi:MAG: DUF2207 domain-containing protein [Actinomycetota bacterium]|nr:DUF2207 domain-containing protein [Actinomycetota bacterium]